MKVVMNKYFSLKIMSHTWNCSSTVAKGAFKGPLSTINKKSVGGGALFNIVRGVSIRSFRKSVSGPVLHKALLSMRQLMFTSPKAIGKDNISRFFSTVSLLIVGESLRVRLVLPGVLVEFGRQ